MLITDTHVYFYSTKDCFSNFYPATFNDPDYNMFFNCSEQNYMVRKADHFKDTATAEAIMKETNPRIQKALGRSVVGFDEKEWNRFKVYAMSWACTQKFRQNPELLEVLIATGDRMIVEASPTDRVWGCGLKETDPLILDEANWTGINLLGRVLVDVRDYLKLPLSEQNNYKAKLDISNLYLKNNNQQ